jgi:hypothetical protein
VSYEEAKKVFDYAPVAPGEAVYLENEDGEVLDNYCEPCENIEEGAGMMRFAFISRHQMTEEQASLAQEQGIELIPVGDMDAFSVCVDDVEEKGAFDGVIVVHPAMALALARSFLVGVFENGTRPGEGEKPQFFAKALYVYDLKD